VGAFSVSIFCGEKRERVDVATLIRTQKDILFEELRGEDNG